MLLLPLANQFIIYNSKLRESAMQYYLCHKFASYVSQTANTYKQRIDLHAIASDDKILFVWLYLLPHLQYPDA